MKDSLLNSALLRRDPVWGTISFAVVYSAVKLSADWLFRWSIPDKPRPPVWSLVLTIGIGTLIASAFVYLLLTVLKRQREALETLNHELRNSLQVLSYAVTQCDDETRHKAQEAIANSSDAVRKISQRLGMISQREYRPGKV